VLRRFLLRKLHRSVAAAEANKTKRMSKSHKHDKAKLAALCVPTATDTVRALWFATGDPGHFDVESKFKSLDLLDKVLDYGFYGVCE